MTKAFSTAQLLDRIESHPDRYGKTTLESGRSVPVLIRGEQGPALAVFWYPVGGPFSGRHVYAPYLGATVPLAAPDAVLFRPIDPGMLGLSVRHDGTVGPAGIGDVKTIEEAEALETKLYESLDRLAPRFLSAPATLTPAERSAAREYLSAVDKLAQVVLRGAYRATSPEFFSWLEAAAVE